MRIPTEPWCKNRIGTMWFALEYSYRSTSFYKLHLPGKSTTALDAMNLPWVILYPAREDAGNIILKTNLEITQNLLISFSVTNVSSPIAFLNMRGSSKEILSYQPPNPSIQLHQRIMQARPQSQILDTERNEKMNCSFEKSSTSSMFIITVRFKSSKRVRVRHRLWKLSPNNSR